MNDKTKIILTQELAKQMAEDAKTSPVALAKLASAKAHLAQIKPQLERLLSSK